MNNGRWRVCSVNGTPHFWGLTRELLGCSIDVTVWLPGNATVRGIVSATGFEGRDILEHARIGGSIQVRLDHSRTMTGYGGADVLLIVTDRIRTVGNGGG